MRRRAFILVVALLLAAVAAQAEQAGRVHRIGVLMNDGSPPGLLEAFREGLHELGYVEGKNITIELRNAEGKNERLSALANELVRLKVDVILAVNTPSAHAAKKATTTTPIVITRVADPVGSGLVPSLARPDGNVTGLSILPEGLSPKRIQLLREILPGISRLVVLFNADNPGSALVLAETERASSQVGLQVLRLPVRGPSDFPGAFQVATRARAEALFVLDDAVVTKYRGQILRLATNHSLPVVSTYKDFVEAGGLLAYGPNLPAAYRRAAYYADRILKGAKPSDLPVEEPTQLDLVVNLKTAKALGLTIPPSVLLSANHVIE
jgi:putative ABC transport system substrate-binding protein